MPPTEKRDEFALSQCLPRGSRKRHPTSKIGNQFLDPLALDRRERSSEKLQRFDNDVQDQRERRGPQYCHQAVNGYVQHGLFDSNYPINHPTHRSTSDLHVILDDHRHSARSHGGRHYGRGFKSRKSAWRILSDGEYSEWSILLTSGLSGKRTTCGCVQTFHSDHSLRTVRGRPQLVCAKSTTTMIVKSLTFRPGIREPHRG